jgi:hypothetical protein
MKKLLFAVLLFSACSRDTVERASPPVSTTEQATTSTPAPEAPQPPAAPSVNGPKLAFVDEGAKDPSFVAYREKLLAAVRARDAKGVVALADPKIRTSFGGGGGAADLEKLLARPGMFEQFEQILTLGGSFREGSFWAPYVYSAYPDSSDAFSTVAVIADDVPLHEQADASSKVLATLSHDIVDRVAAPGERGAWLQVKTADGKTGYVESKFVRSPIDYRAGFLKSNGTWRMNALVAGD